MSELAPLMSAYRIPPREGRILVATPGMLHGEPSARWEAPRAIDTWPPWSGPKPVAVGRLTLGEYTFPHTFRIIGTSNDSEMDETRIPYQDGAYIPTQNKSAKIIRVTGVVGFDGFWDSAGLLCRDAHDVDNELQVMASYLEAGYRQLRYDGFGKDGKQMDKRFIWALKRRFGVEYLESTQQKFATIEIEFVCQEAKWHADKETTVFDIANGTTQTKFFNQLFGSGISYPVVRFDGPCIAPTIEVGYGRGKEFGFIGVQFGPNMVLSSGQQLVVDCDPRSPRRAGFFPGGGAPPLDAIGTIVRTVNVTGDSAFFPYIRPGMDHVLSVTTGAGSSGPWVFGWRDVWTY